MRYFRNFESSSILKIAILIVFACLLKIQALIASESPQQQGVLLSPGSQISTDWTPIQFDKRPALSSNKPLLVSQAPKNETFAKSKSLKRKLSFSFRKANTAKVQEFHPLF